MSSKTAETYSIPIDPENIKDGEVFLFKLPI